MRALAEALIGGGISRRDRYERWDDAIRTRLPTSRRVGVVQVEPGVGATTITREVARVLAERRTGPVLVADATATTGGVASRWDLAEASPHEARDDARSADPRTTADAVDGLARGPEGQFVMRVAGRHAASIDAWLDLVAPITRFFEVVLTEFGVRHPLDDLAACAALCDVVCLVSRADRASAEQSRALAAALHELPERPDVVLVLVDARRTALGAPQVVAAHSPDPVVLVPADAGLARGQRPVTPAARAAVLRACAAVLVGEQER